MSPVQKGSAQESHELALSPFARLARASPVSLELLVPLVPPVSLKPLVSRALLESPALLALSPNLAERPQSGFARAARSFVAGSRFVHVASTVRSTVFAKRTARREFCNGAACSAAWHYVGAVQFCAACCITACNAF